MLTAAFAVQGLHPYVLGRSGMESRTACFEAVCFEALMGLQHEEEEEGGSGLLVPPAETLDDTMEPIESESEAEPVDSVRRLLEGRQAAPEGQSPWAVRPTTVGRSRDLTPGEVERLRTEQHLSCTADVPWQERGPVPGYGVEAWRGQPLRWGLNGGKVRYAKRGGKHREWYRDLAKQGVLPSQSSGSGKGKGKGSGHSSSSGKGMGKQGGHSSSSGKGKGKQGGQT